MANIRLKFKDTKTSDGRYIQKPEPAVWPMFNTAVSEGGSAVN